MLKHTSLIALGFLCLLLSELIAFAQNSADDAADRDPTTREQSRTIPTPFPVQIVEDSEVAEARRTAQTEGLALGRESLALQQIMTAATERMNVATQRLASYSYYSNWLVAIGTVLLIVTLWLTWKANQAAISAVKVTEDVGARQIRPWVTFHDVKAQYQPNLNIKNVGEVKAIVFRLYWKNVGLSPGVDANIFTQVEIIEEGKEIPELNVRKKLGKAVIGPGSMPHGITYCLWGGDIESFRSRSIDLIIFSRIDYRDSVSREERYSEVTIRCVHELEEMLEDQPHPVGISAIVEGANNNAT